MNRLLAMLLLMMVSTGCRFLPTAVRQPAIHNPLPQLSSVAVAPFFNQSSEPSVDGRQFALAYFNELQSIPGFEVVPVSRVESKMRQLGLSLTSVEDVRLLAQALEVDAVVVGAVTDFTPYYPPRLGLRVEWYAANPGFHPVPPGYGLPWGTPEEEHIPGELIFEAEMALAREQLKTQEPIYVPAKPEPMMQPRSPTSPIRQPSNMLPPPERTVRGKTRAAQGGVQLASVQEELPEPVVSGSDASLATTAGLPADWPDPAGFTPAPPQAERPTAVVSKEPVLRHTRSYNGHDPRVTTALENYYFFRDDARFGGWQSYLQRSDDYIRFCCHMHIAEMLTARGGGGESRVVWRWPLNR